MMPAWPGAPPPSNMPPQWQNMQQATPQPYFWPNQGNFPIPGPQMQPNQNITNQNDPNKEILNPKNPEEEHKLVSLQMQAQQWQQQKQMQEWLGNQNPQQSTKIDSTPIMSAEMIKAKNDKLQELNTVKKEEEEFDKQYREWEKQFEQWKDQNKDHPNKDQFKQYEEQWNQWKSQMNDKRTEILSKKSAVEKALAALTLQQPPIQNPFQQTAPLSYGQYPGMPQPNNMIPQQPGIPPVPYNQQGGGAYPNNPMASNPQGTMMPGPYQNMGGVNYQPQPPLGPQPPSSLMYGGGGGVNSNPNMPGMNPAMPHPRAGDGMSGMQNIYGSHQQPPGNQNSYNGVNANTSNQIPSYNVGPGGNMNPNLGPNPINQRNQPATNPFTYGGSTSNLPLRNDGRNQQKSFNNDRDGTFQFQRSTREEDYDYDDSLNDTATDYGNSDYRDGNSSSAPFNDNTQTMMPPGVGPPHQQSFDYGGKGDMGGGGSFYNGSQRHPHPSRFGGPPIGSDYHPGRPGPAFPPRPRPAYPRGPGINSYSGGGGMMGASRMPPPHARAPFNGASGNAMRNEGMDLPPYIATGAGDRGSESSSSLQRERKKSSRWGEPVDTNEDSTSATQVNSYPKDSSRHDQVGHLENDGGDGDPKLGLLGEAPDRGYGSGGGGMRPNPAMMMRMMMMNRGGGMMGGPPAGPMAAAANMMRAMMMMRARGAMMAGRGGGSGPPFFPPHPRGPGGFGPRRGFHHHDRRDHGGYGHRGGANRDGRRSRSRSPHPHDGHGRGENDSTDDRNGADEDKSGPGAWNRNAKDGSGGGPRGDGGLSATPRMGTPNKMLPGGGPHNDMGMMGRPRHMQNYGYQNQQGRRSGDYPDSIMMAHGEFMPTPTFPNRCDIQNSSYDQNFAQNYEQKNDGAYRTSLSQILSNDAAEPFHKTLIVLRGIPGSGKSRLSKIIKDKAVAGGKPVPRILSLDDYFVTEVDKDAKNERGDTVSSQTMEYRYEPALETTYLDSLKKSLRKQLDTGTHEFLIMDSVNDKLSHYEETVYHATRLGYQVCVAQLLTDPSTAHGRDIHGRSIEDLRRIADRWEPTPPHFTLLDIDSPSIEGNQDPNPDHEKERDRELNKERDMVKEIKKEGLDMESRESVDDLQLTSPGPESVDPQHSRWEFDQKEENLYKLDGLNLKKLASHDRPSMEEYLQLPDDYESRQPRTDGKKRVRWADVEERKDQTKKRAMGFVMGQTDWRKMVDDQHPEKALNRTKYI